jgi:hypothetical protein
MVNPSWRTPSPLSGLVPESTSAVFEISPSTTTEILQTRLPSYRKNFFWKGLKEMVYLVTIIAVPHSVETRFPVIVPSDSDDAQFRKRANLGDPEEKITTS